MISDKLHKAFTTIIKSYSNVICVCTVHNIPEIRYYKFSFCGQELSYEGFVMSTH
jgi:hypothetical protein